MINYLFGIYCIYPLECFVASEEVRVALCLVRGAFFIFLEDLRLLSFLVNATPESFFKFGFRFLLSSDSTSSSSRNTKTIITVSKHLNFMSKICNCFDYSIIKCLHRNIPESSSLLCLGEIGARSKSSS